MLEFLDQFLCVLFFLEAVLLIEKRRVEVAAAFYGAPFPSKLRPFKERPAMTR